MQFFTSLIKLKECYHTSRSQKNSKFANNNNLEFFSTKITDKFNRVKNIYLKGIFLFLK